MRILIITLLSAYCYAGYGQYTINGRVIDEEGNPIPFATIRPQMAYKNGTITDSNGNFKLDYMHFRDTLICSHTSYQTKKEGYEGNNKIVFRLVKKPVVTELFLSGESYAAPMTIPPSVPKNNSKQQEDKNIVFSEVEIPATFGYLQ